ncbi:uncharacterized protein [Miscanthus floridulus]|uniref:uncharacterized protein n=1 Tax=Miscanthus floridulus TaxID=154761 RepID=UPI003459B457
MYGPQSFLSSSPSLSPAPPSPRPSSTPPPPLPAPSPAPDRPRSRALALALARARAAHGRPRPRCHRALALASPNVPPAHAAALAAPQRAGVVPPAPGLVRRVARHRPARRPDPRPPRATAVLGRAPAGPGTCSARRCHRRPGSSA